MANTISKQTVLDGERNLAVKIDILGDGSGDETATLLIDISSYTASFTQGVPTSFKINRIQSTLEGFTARLLWDANTPVVAYDLPQSHTIQKFERVGGLINNAGTGVTGDLKITTSGLGSGDAGSILLEMVKKYG